MRRWIAERVLESSNCPSCCHVTGQGLHILEGGLHHLGVVDVVIEITDIRLTGVILLLLAEDIIVEVRFVILRQ